LSKPFGLRLVSEKLLLPHAGKGDGVSRTVIQTDSNCKAQTSSMAYSNKMIKEDHLLACTTRHV